MLTMFRRLRKVFLQSNQFRKYLAYAVGEILLVMIGILLALQVSNWNQERIEDNKRSDFVELLLRDLTKDTLIINEGIRQMSLIMDAQNALRQRISSEYATKDTLLKIAKYQVTPMLELQFAYTFNTNTMTSLLSTGQLDLFDQVVVDELLTLYAMQNESIEDFKNNSRIFLNLVAEHGREFRFNTPFTMIQGGPMLELAWSKVDFPKLANSISILGGSKTFNAYSGISHLKRIKKQTLNTILLLNSYTSSSTL